MTLRRAGAVPTGVHRRGIAARTGRRLRARAAVAAAAVCAAALLAGCGEREEVIEPTMQTPLEIVLSSFPAVAHAPVYAADATGRFDELGLAAELRESEPGARPIEEVASGDADLAVAHEADVIAAREAGLPVIGVAALVQRPLVALITLPDGKGSGAAGRAGGGTVGIGIAGYSAAFVEAVIEGAAPQGEDGEQRDAGADPAAELASGRFDVLLGTWSYDGEALRLRDRDPQVVRAEQAGVPIYDELVLVASERALEQDEGAIRSAIAGLAEATERLEDPRTLDALAEASGADPELRRAALAATQPLFEPPAGRPYGWQEPADREQFADFARRVGIVDEPVALERTFTNELLPGEGL